MHGGGIDLLDHAETPALHFGVGYETKSVKQELVIVARAAIGEGSISCDPDVAAAAKILASKAAELIVISAIFAEERGRAKRAEPHTVHRAPHLPPERLHIPDFGILDANFPVLCEGRKGIPVDDFCLPQAVDAETRRLMQDGGTDLMKLIGAALVRVEQPVRHPMPAARCNSR